MEAEVISDEAVQVKTGLSSVANAMRLIKMFSDERLENGISDMAIQLQLPKSTVHRLATTLVETGMLAQDQVSGKYRLGLTMAELGSVVQRNMHRVRRELR
jgi:IclR family KDG regulon transcriptional repressor